MKTAARPEFCRGDIQSTGMTDGTVAAGLIHRNSMIKIRIQVFYTVFFCPDTVLMIWQWHGCQPYEKSINIDEHVAGELRSISKAVLVHKVANIVFRFRQVKIHPSGYSMLLTMLTSSIIFAGIRSFWLLGWPVVAFPFRVQPVRAPRTSQCLNGLIPASHRNIWNVICYTVTGGTRIQAIFSPFQKHRIYISRTLDFNTSCIEAIFLALHLQDVFRSSTDTWRAPWFLIHIILHSV